MKPVKTLKPVIVFVCLFAVGCSTTTQQRMDALQQAIDQGVAITEQLSSDMTELKTLAADIRQQIQTSEPESETAAKLSGLLSNAVSKIDQIQKQKEDILAQVQQYQAKLTEIRSQAGVGLGDEFELAAEAIKQTSPHLPPPWSIYASLLGTTVAGIGGWLRQRGKTKQATEVATGLVQSVDNVLARAKVGTVDDQQIKVVLREMPVNIQVGVHKVKAGIL